MMWFTVHCLSSLLCALAFAELTGGGPEGENLRIGLIDEALETFPDKIPVSITDRLSIHVPRNSIAVCIS
jgi:hypothetical protein